MDYWPILVHICLLSWILTSVLSASTSTTTTTSPPTTTTTAAPPTTSTIASTTTSNNSLACFDCTETFKRVWEPYTNCQYYPTRAPLRSCLSDERYCKVEQVSYRDMTVSITRGCTESCYHGCYAFGFGLTRLKCTSCCRAAGCNVGSRASRVSVSDFTTLSGCVFLALLLSRIGGWTLGL